MTEEIAKAEGVNARTVRRDWQKARAFLPRTATPALTASHPMDPTLDRERWSHLSAILDGALDLPPEARPQY
jgi:hypothetical protein